MDDLAVVDEPDAGPGLGSEDEQAVARGAGGVLRLVREHATAPFDLSRPPLFRWLLVRLADDDHRLVHTEHHLSHDGRSFTVLLADLFESYRAGCAGQPATLDPAPGYQEYVEHCRTEGYRAEADRCSVACDR